jgi:hypothetical protein
MILGPMTEQALRQSLDMSQGDHRAIPFERQHHVHEEGNYDAAIPIQL